METSHTMSALDPLEPVEFVKRRCSAGFLRLDELPRELADPRVLFLGDSHLDGVVDTTRNVTTMLEGELRREGVHAWMLNAGCAFYSLWQYVLRARELVPRYRPALIVTVVFCGNDFVELEDLTRPYLTDTLEERAEDPAGSYPTISGSVAELDLGLFKHLFPQGLWQADWFHHRAERLPIVLRKAAHAVDAMEALAREHGARVLWVLLPSADLVFREKLQGLAERAQNVVDSGIQKRIHDDFAALLAERDCRVLDMLEPFREDGHLGLYATDFHVFLRGHQLMADRLLPLVRAELTGR